MRFAIIASPRTGSTHLVTMLSRQKDVLCNGEVFHPSKIYLRWPKEHSNAQDLAELTELRRADPLAFMNRIFETGHGSTHVGFKIFRGQNDEMLENILTDSGIRKIILYRRNVLANYSSGLVAKLTNTWGSGPGAGDRSEAPKVQFKKKHFLRFHDNYIGFYRDVLDRMRAAHQDSHLIGYEEVNNPWLLRSLVDYIGADSAAVKIAKRQPKRKPSNIVDRFSNKEEVETFLHENQLTHWTYEGEFKFDLLDSEPSPAKRPNKARLRKKQRAATSESELSDGPGS